MSVSTKTRYALRMLIDIAAYQDSGKVKIKEVSSRQDISVKYLEQIVTTLSKAGIVKGERGPQGGYVLTRPASEITVAEIVTLLDGGISPVSCIKDDCVECDRKDRCSTLDMWMKINKAVMDIMKDTTIQDLVDDAISKGIIKFDNQLPEYYI